MRILFLLLLMACSAFAQTYTEFYCDASVSANNTNVNAGSTTGAPVYGPSVNGNWDGTSVFTPTDGTTPASTVSAGMWMSVYYDNSTNLVQAGTMGGIIALVTNVAAGVNGAITVDRQTISGTSPTSSATGRSARVGGSWAGPYGTIGFPFGFITAVSTNGPYTTRVNFKNASSYVITAAVAHNNAGPTTFQGYASSPGDGGKASILDNTTSTSYALMTLNGSAVNIEFSDFIISSSFSVGTSVGFNVVGGRNRIWRVVVHDVRNFGFAAGGSLDMFEECEAYRCNQNNSANVGGFRLNATGVMAIRCISHDNSGNNSCGFTLDGNSVALFCVADTNGKEGFLISNSTGQNVVLGCDAYNNGANGLNLSSATASDALIENCNFIKNTAWGINTASVSLRSGAIVNCGFGAGTQVNGSGAIAPIQGMYQISNFNYAADATPWVDPANGDFRINLKAAKAAGRGLFTQTQASYSGTVAYPDVGSAQSASTNSAAGGSYTFAQ